MHLISVFPSIIGNSLPFYHIIAGDKNLSGNLLIEMPSLPKTSLTNFIPVNSNGSYKDSSSRKGLISMIPLPTDTLFDPVQGNRYIYKALPTLIPACDYMFVKKDTITDRIDTVYVPIVVYSKPINGLPTGCYGAGGLVGDTIKLPYVIYPNPRIYRKGLITTPSCPTDSIITFKGVDSSLKVTVGTKTLISPAIRWIWKISGTYKNNPVNYLDTAKITSHAFDTGTKVCISLTTIFTNGATNYFDSCFMFITSKVKFGVFPLRLCLGQPIKVLDSTYSRTGVDSIYWNFGDGKFITYSKGFDTNYVYKDTGSFTIRHTVKINGCNAAIDTVVQKVYVSAKRFPVIVYPLNCIDTSGRADFWYDSTGGGVPIKTYKWYFGDPASNAADSSSLNPTFHIYPKENIYTVKLYVVDTSGCKGDTTTTVNIHILPHILFKPFATGICANGSPINIKDSALCLNKQRVQGYGKFKGPGITDTLGIFDPSKANPGVNTIWYIYTSGSGACVDSVSQQITVWAKPTVDYSYSPAGCLPKDGIASFLNLSSNSFSFIWNFDDAANSTAGNPNVVDSIHTKHTFANTGLHNIKLVATSADGCKDSTAKAITFSVTPAINYPAFPAAGICESQTTVPVNTASITNGVTLASGNYYGNGVSLTGSLSPAVSGYGNDSLTYIATSTGGCADTAIQYILVKARPRIGFTYPAGCLPANGIVQFTDTSKIPDGQTVQSCTWNFGHSSAGNPGTANVCSPSHIYPYGTYTIYHTVTSSLGCTTDTTFNATFSISPSLYFKPIPSVCENITSDTLFSLAGSNNITAVPGSGVFKGPGIVDSVKGIFNPFLAGSGTHTIHYIFTATSGCSLDTTQTITVNARPKGQFTFTPNGCLNASGTVQFDASAITVQGSTISSYNWKFEGVNSSIVNGVNPTHNYSDGTDTILLNIQAANGCSFDTMQVKAFSRVPLLDVLVQNSVCENGGTITLQPANVMNAVAGAGVFSSFKNAVTNTTTGTYDPTISGCGVDTIYYTFTTTAGCAATQKLAVTILCRPRGVFTFTPNGVCLDTAGIVQFDASGITAPSSTIQSYNWDFGNGTGSGVNPTNVYNEGTYTIKLNVKANNTCSFDTSVTTTFSRTPHLDTISLSYICTNGGTANVIPPKVLNGVNGTGSFSSFKGACSATGVYDPAISGFGVDTIYYTYTSVGGCVATSKFAATIKSRPTGTFTYSPLTGCLNTNGIVQFDASNFTAPGSSVSGYTWDFGSTPTAGTGVNPTHDYNDGTYNIKLRVDAANGCWFDTAMNATFNKTPLLDTIPSINPCENGGTVNLTAPKILNGASGIGVFSSFKNAVTGNVYDPSKAGYGIDTLYYILTSAGGCSATQKLAITVKARPYGIFTFTPNTGCLDVTGKVTFTSNISVPNAAISSSIWNFGDVTPNGSGIIVSHNYADGTFTIKLTTTGNNGCSSDTSLTTTFNRTPLLANLQQGDTCENIGLITLRTPQVINAVAGTGVFSSFKNAVTNASAGTYDPAKAGYGIDTIFYTYTSAAGCVATKSLAIRILGRPRGQFTFTPNTGCLDVSGLVKFSTSGISVPGSSVKTYTWDFEAPSTLTGTGGAPTHPYSDGTYDIKLNVLGNNTCSFDTMMTQKFSRTPSLDPIVIKNVCANDAPFTLTAPNVNNGVAGPTGVFTSYRNAVTGNGAVGYTYTPLVGSYIIDTIYYKFISNNGCEANGKKIININPVPQIKLKVSSDVCKDTTTKFSDVSTIKSGHIDSTWWHFYDSTYVNPVGGIIDRTFDSAATYTIYFTAKSDSGCMANDSAKITARPQPVALFTKGDVVCMPKGTVYFTNKSTLATNGGTMNYAWNFGDAAGSGINLIIVFKTIL
ncbi:MAG: PKD domain-containing protein [Bacteroidetes bacterium]|nr:PKD domain-containing protein [Bacteroidota bacterium]